VLTTFIKYNFIQVLAYGLELGLFFLVLSLGANMLVVANVFAKIVAGICTFLSHKYYTFRKRSSERIFGEALAYFALLGANTFFSSYLLVLFTNYLPAGYAKPLADIICVGINFILTHTVVFGRKSKDNSDQ